MTARQSAVAGNGVVQIDIDVITHSAALAAALIVRYRHIISLSCVDVFKVQLSAAGKFILMIRVLIESDAANPIW